LSKDISEFMKLYKERSISNPNNLVFCKNSGFLDEWSLNKKLSKYLKKVDLRKIRFHDLRHTFASHLAINGISIQRIQKLLGHSDIRMTQRYSHLGSYDLEGVGNNLTPLFNKDSKALALLSSNL